MKRSSILLILTAAVAAACGGASTEAPAAPAPTPGNVRAAALARMTIENRTDRRVRIAYRLAGGAASSVTVGTVEPQSELRVAPVPAGEPLLIFAIDEQGARLSLPPRTLEIDEEWRWVIPLDAPFTQPAGGAR